MCKITPIKHCSVNFWSAHTQLSTLHNIIRIQKKRKKKAQNEVQALGVDVLILFPMLLS